MPDAAASRGSWIFVVDDDAALREVICEIFEDAGYVVHAARGGVAALALLRSHPEPTPPAAILLDVMMSDGDGFEFRDEQRKDAELSAIPVVVMTASGRPEARIFAMEANAHVSKPFDVEDLLSIVARVIDPKTQKT
jgi:CheY-like chemotaxis protein